MTRGIRIGRLGGVPVRVGLSWLVIVPLVGTALFAGVDASLGSFGARGIVAGAGALVMFASVIVHELGHAAMAHRRGIHVDQVVVFLFGGYSEMDMEAAEPTDDIAISAAGPMASSVLAVLMMGLALVSPEWAGTRRTLALLGLVNVGVALFNLLPGFPLDGGRIVRAALISAGASPRRAEQVTARLGMFLGAVTIGLGAWFSIRGAPAALIVVPVGLLLVIIAAAAHPRRDRASTHQPPPQPSYEET